MTQGHSSTPGQSVVHFESIGRDLKQLLDSCGASLGSTYVVGEATTDRVSAPVRQGWIDASTHAEGGINGGVGGGPTFAPHVLGYIGVPDVAAALAAAGLLNGWAASA